MQLKNVACRDFVVKCLSHNKNSYYFKMYKCFYDFVKIYIKEFITKYVVYVMYNPRNNLV